MAKLNLSALKRQAGNPAPKSDDIVLSNVVEISPQLLVSESATPALVAVTQDTTETKYSSSAVTTSSPIAVASETTPQTIREFFPNLIV